MYWIVYKWTSFEMFYLVNNIVLGYARLVLYLIRYKVDIIEWNVEVIDIRIVGYFIGNVF